MVVTNAKGLQLGASCLKKANKIKERVLNVEKFQNVAKSLNLEIKGVKPFTRVLPDSSELPIPLISKIFDSDLKIYIRRPVSSEKIDLFSFDSEKPSKISFLI